ncbi:gluconate 2-dehydrogenase subunit 3 family protein [Marinihelvus fidelis]|uniref:Gluconate 2-dehydrogenase subunit 3 family protein n=1 Tax=Marinihelvus fidelis TaxID=2613842 RepID=A0A5N0TC43_9GAMM|nr:gluconate 2-dehydrogenase subunit 3 family protein [Marinihelvus fidelis]KAA9132653.1 gluconate 2-dehydrogenase subunit 3 family protein [Marinihelvus fidelis]
MSNPKTNHDKATTPSRVTRNASRLTRREALRAVSLALGGTLVGGSSLLASVAGYADGEEPAIAKGKPFTAAETALLDEVAETILPRTDTPGAKDANVGAFIAFMVADAYSPTDRALFRNGMLALQQASQADYGSDFEALDAADRTALLNRFDKEQQQHGWNKGKDAPHHWFRMMKELTLLGFFTSEVGMTQALRYVEAPGRYDPCAPYEQGDPAWADHA